MGPHRTSQVRRVIRSVVVVLTAIAITGCAHALSQPMPDLKGRLALKVLNEQPSKMSEMPIGVHQIPDTSVYVSGHQGAAGVGVLFGIIGVAAAHAAAQSTGEKKTQDVQAQLRLDTPRLRSRCSRRSWRGAPMRAGSRPPAVPATARSRSSRTSS